MKLSKLFQCSSLDWRQRQREEATNGVEDDIGAVEHVGAKAGHPTKTQSRKALRERTQPRVSVMASGGCGYG